MKKAALILATALAMVVSGQAQSSFYRGHSSRNSVAQHERRERIQLQRHQRSERAACGYAKGPFRNCAGLKGHEQRERAQLKAHQRSERRSFRRF